MTHFFHFECLQPRKSWSWNTQRRPKSEPHSSQRRSKATQNGKGVSVESQLLEEALAGADQKNSAQTSWTCSICSQIFTSKPILRHHIKGQHLGQFRLECSHCEKKFWNPEDLDGHVAAIHTDIKLYACPCCEKSFSYRKTLVKHLKRSHPGTDYHTTSEQPM